MGLGGCALSLVGTLLVGSLAVACGAGAPPRVEVIRLEERETPAANGVREQQSVRQAERAGTLEWARAGARVGAHVGAAVAARFALRNGGGRYLVLHGLLPDCGCRLASALPDALAPGAEVAFTLVCRAPSAGGEIVRESLLLSNDPARPVEPLRVRIAVALPPAAPAALYFGYVPVGGSATRRLVVGESAGHADNADTTGGADDRGRRGAVSGGAASARAESVTVTDDIAISVEPLPPPADGKRAYQVSFAPRATGVMRATLGFGDHPSAVTVSGVGFRTVLVFPPEVTLPSETTAGGPPVIAVKSIDDAPLEITRIELPVGLTGDLKTVVPGHEYRLTLRAHRRQREGTNDAIRLHTSAPDEPLVAIPVRYAQTLVAKIPTAQAGTR